MVFLFNSFMLGVGLAMDAFSISMTGGLAEPDMPVWKRFLIAGTFGLFQFAMPVAGWALVAAAEHSFEWFTSVAAYIASALLFYIGGKLLADGLRIRGNDEEEGRPIELGALFMLGVATSIDALSVGFAIAEYSAGMAVLSAFIIGIVTFLICLGGIELGKKFAALLKWRAFILGGFILIGIGLELLIGELIA